ncbi:hypothetical protein [Sporosarcina sp. P16b]|nr:hypothetical protein [Sporosarcina sp. P16b]
MTKKIKEKIDSATTDSCETYCYDETVVNSDFILTENTNIKTTI